MQIINKITEVPKVKNEVGSSRATHTLSLRGERVESEVAIHRVSEKAVGFVSSFTDSQWIATGFALAMTTHSLSLRGGSVASDAAIHRVLSDAYDLSLRLLVLSGSPRAFSHGHDNTRFVIARKERSERRGNPSCLAQRLRLVSLLAGSQWIATGFTLAMTRVSKTIQNHQSALRSSQFGLSFSIS